MAGLNNICKYGQHFKYGFLQFWVGHPYKTAMRHIFRGNLILSLCFSVIYMCLIIATHIEGTPMRHLVIVSIIVALIAVTQVNADCLNDQYGKVLCGRGKCELDQFGRVICTQRYGGIMKDRYGNILCGVGHCTKDSHGQIWCSVEEDGSVNIDMYGNVKCLGGCETGKSSICEEGR